MSKIAGILLSILCAASMAQAQIPTSGNIFVGYSFSQTDSFGGTTALNGWEASLEGKILPWIGIVGDFGAGYGTDNFAPPVPPPLVDFWAAAFVDIHIYSAPGFRFPLKGLLPLPKPSSALPMRMIRGSLTLHSPPRSAADWITA